MSGPDATAISIRPARPGDDAALVALAEACPMRGALTLCSRRAPSFFALNRLEEHGGTGRVLVAEGPDAAPIGCVAWAARDVFIDGRARRAGYGYDFKVHPAWRQGAVADALTQAFAGDLGRTEGPDLPALVTVLAGNRAMQRRLPGPRGLVRFDRFAVLRALSIPVRARRRGRVAAAGAAGVDVEAAGSGDLEEMAALWAKVAPGRQFAPVLDAAALASFIEAVPGLAPASFVLARRRDAGRSLAGFLAVWDPSPVRQSVVLRWGPRLAAARLLWNATAPWLGTERLPAAGSALRQVAALLVCVPAATPGVLRALVLEAERRQVGRAAFLTVGLDRRDPLGAGLAGLGGQPTFVWACATAPAGRWAGPRLDGRPVHFETALT